MNRPRVRTILRACLDEFKSRVLQISIVPVLCVYALAVILLIAPLTTWGGVASGVLAATAGVLIALWLHERACRLPAIVVGSLLVAAIGMGAGAWLGHVVWAPRLLGTSVTLLLIDVAQFGSLVLGAVILLRTLTTRWPMYGVVELGALFSGIVISLANHRDLRLGQPREFSDWVFSRGWDPVAVLTAVGLVTLALGMLMLQRPQRVRRMAAATGALIAVLLLGLWIFARLPASLIKPPSQTAQSDLEVLPAGDQGGEAQRDDANGGDREDSNPNPDARAPSNDNPQPPAKPQSGETGDDSEPVRPGDPPASIEAEPEPEPAGSEPRDDLPNGDLRESSGEPPPQPRPWPQPAAGGRGQPVALVMIDDEYVPAEPMWYFRENACSQFNGRRLVPAANAEIDNDVPAGMPSQRVQLDCVPQPKEHSRVVPATVHLLVEQTRPFGLVAPVAFKPRDNPDPDYFRMSYEVWSCVPFTAGRNGVAQHPYQSLMERTAGNPTWSTALRNHYLALPDDPRYRELANEIVTQLPPNRRHSPLARSLAIARWIAQNTTYTSRVDHSSADDPAASFLFGSRRGYCVHVAHAMVYLLRSLDIPARAGTGYAVPQDWVGQSKTILVMDSDAHAWPEIYLQGAGWVVVDTAPERIDPNEPKPVPPDAATRNFLRQIATQPDNPVPYERQPAFGVGLPDWKTLLCLSVLALYVVKVWRYVIPRFAPERDLNRVGFRAILDRLAEVGLCRKFGETREQFACRVAGVIPDFEQVTRSHLNCVLAGTSDRVASRETWLAWQQQTDQRIAAISSRWRRTLALVNPIAWLWVR